MNTFKTELHAHTAETSNCGKATAKELVEGYIGAGYKTVVITDHLSTHTYFRYDYDNMSWDDKIDVFMLGYNAAKEAAKGRINILLGMEMRFDCKSANDYLVFGVTENFLRNNGDLINMNIGSFSELVHKNGLLIFQAHPFRKDMDRVPASLLDGVEVHNGCVRQDSHNDKAMELADKYGLLKSSGSDYHQIDDVAHGGIITESEIKTNADLLSTLRSRNYELIL